MGNRKYILIGDIEFEIWSISTDIINKKVIIDLASEELSPEEFDKIISLMREKNIIFEKNYIDENPQEEEIIV